MTDDIEVEEPQVTDDPFKKYGGQQIKKTATDDPFAKFGGKQLSANQPVKNVGNVSQGTSPRADMSFLGSNPFPKPATDNTRAIQPAQSAATGDVKQVADVNWNDKVNAAVKNTVQAYKKMSAPDYASKISDNSPDMLKKAQDLQNGLKDGSLQIIPSPTTGQPIFARKAGFLSSLWDGYNNAYNDAQQNANIAGMTTQEKVNHFEAEKQGQNEYLPEAPSGVGGALGKMVGENAPTLMKAGAYAAGTTAMATGLGEVGVAADAASAGKLGTFISFAQDMGNSGYANTLRKTYNSILQQHPEMDKEDAMKQAEGAALAGGAIGIGTALAMGGIPGKLSAVAKDIPAQGFINSVGALAKSTGMETAKMSGIAAGGSVASDIAANVAGANIKPSEIANNAIEQAKGMATLTGAMGLLTGIANIPGYLKAQSENVVSKAPRDEVQQIYQGAEQQGIIPPGTTDKVMGDLNKFDSADAAVPKNLPDEHRAALKGLIVKKQGIEADNAAIDPVLQQPSDNAPIQQINEQMKAIAKSENPLLNEVDSLTGQPAETEQSLKSNKTDEFASRIANGEKMTSPEDLQFYENNKSEIENKLKSISSPKTENNEETNNAQTERGQEGNVTNEGTAEPKGETVPSIDPLKDVESTTKLLKEQLTNKEDLIHYLSLTPPEFLQGGRYDENAISEAYHDAKKNGNNEPLVKAVESLIPKENEPTTIQQPNASEEKEGIKVNDQTEATKQPDEGVNTEGSATEETTGIKNEVTKEERAKKGLSEVEIEAKRTMGDVFDKGKEMVDNGEIDPRLLAKQLASKPRPISPEESASLIYDRMRLQKEHKIVSDLLTKATEDKDKLKTTELSVRQSKIEDEIENNDTAARKTGYEQGLGLAARKMMIKEDYSLANQLQQFKNANNGEVLPDNVRVKISDYVKQLDEANKKMEDYERKINDIQAGKSVSGIKRNVDREKRNAKRAVTKDEIKKERESILDEIKKIATEQRTKLSGNPIPIELIPSLTKLVKNYIHDGIISLDGIVDNAYNDLKDHIEGLKKEDIKEFIGNYLNEENQKKLDVYKTRLKGKEEELTKKLSSGDISIKPKIKISLDDEALRLRSNIEKIKDKIDTERLKVKQASRSNFVKGLDWFAKWRRAVVLSSVKTLGKLTAAAATRQVTNFIEEVGGGLISKVPGLSKIAENAPRHGSGVNIKAEVKSLSQWWKKATYRDIKNIVKSGKGELDYLYGKKRDLPDVALDMIGHIHGALKAPAKRAEFFRSFEKRLDFAAKNGEDISNPIIQTKIAGQSYLDANRAIFMQDNKVTTAYQRAIDYLENEAGNTGKVGATIAKVAIPIVKIPSNYLSETTSYIGGYAKAAPLVIRAMIKGAKELTPEQSDYIIKNIKKGSFGAAIMALGFFNPQTFGGYYTGKNKTGNASPLDVKLFGINIPHWLLHSPIWEAAQFGATIRHVIDGFHSQGKDGGVGEGIWKGGMGVLEESPFVDNTTGFTKNTESIGKFQDAAAEFGKSLIVPPDVEKVAKMLDTDEAGNEIKRKPQNTIQHFEAAIPVLRNNVPLNPVKKVSNPQEPEWKFLSEKNVDLPESNKNQYKIPIENNGKREERTMTDEEFTIFSKKREDYIKEQVAKIMDRGITVDGEYKSASEASAAEIKDRLRVFEEEGTKKIKKEMFDTEGIPHKEKIRVN